MEQDISKDSFIKNWPHWLRWFSFIPAALLGALIISTLWKVIVTIGPTGWGNSIWLDIGQDFILGATFVFLGAATAPKKQLIVGFFLFISVVVLASIISFSALIFHTDRGSALTIMDALITVVGGGVTLYYIYEEEHKA